MVLFSFAAILQMNRQAIHMRSKLRESQYTETLFLMEAGSDFVCRDGNFAVILPASLLIKLAKPWLICVGQKSRGTELLPFASFPLFH